MLCIIVCQRSEKDKNNLNLGERRERLTKLTMEYGGQLQAGFKERAMVKEQARYGLIRAWSGRRTHLCKNQGWKARSLLGDFGVRLIVLTFIFVGSC